ncbi:MAG TPA: AsmA-like C-terminal domain-containing protein, partial [Rhizomicrobium sp.]|nr:AsmA-like C-terminal domain-containing protein [Rhizomicrobium sp.]
LHVRELRLSGHYDGNSNHLSLSQAHLDAKEADVRLSGGADFVYANGEIDSIVPDISSLRAALDMPGVFSGPVALQSVSFRGRWHASSRNFDIERFEINAPQFALSAKGQVQLGNPGQAPGLALTASLQPIAARTLLRYWPMQVAVGAREWIDANIFAGQMGPVSVETHFAPGMLDEAVLPDDAMRLSFPMSGVEGNYVTGLTHLTQVSGTATLTGDNFGADFSGGRVGPLTVTSGHALIPTLHQHGTTGEFSAHIEGAMPDVMTLIDMKPLGYPTRFGVDPKLTTGNASIDLGVRVPMLNSVKVDDIGIQVKADVANYGVVLGKLRFTNGDVEFNIDNNQLRQTGMVGLADARLNVDWTEDFKTSDPITTRLQVKGQVTDAARAALNIGLSSILTGPVGVTAALQGHRGDLRTGDAQLDLTPANILIPIVHLNKPAGQAAGGRVMVNFGAGSNISDETIRLTGPTLAANGTALFDGKGALTQLNFPSVKLGTLNDFSFVLTKNPQGDIYTLRGHAMDGSLVGRNGSTTPASPGANASTPQDETPSGAFRIDAKLDRVAMRDGVTLSPFSMDLTGVGNRPGTLALAATLTQTGLNRTAPLAATVVPTAQGRLMTLNSGDAGMLIRGMFAFESMRGGKMTLTATLPGPASSTVENNPDYSGRLTITDFTMVNQPFLSRLFSAVSFTGVADLLGGQGISVDKLDVPFTSKNSVISIKDSIVSGTVGGTADGYIDRPKNQVALKGSLVPAYGLNSLISNIPVIGDILASKKGEGIIGVTYSATGNADQPNISTNPLSVIAPGILRRIFEGRMPNAATAPSNLPGTNAPAANSPETGTPRNPGNASATPEPQTAQSSAPTPPPAQ